VATGVRPGVHGAGGCQQHLDSGGVGHAHALAAPERSLKGCPLLSNSALFLRGARSTVVQQWFRIGLRSFFFGYVCLAVMADDDSADGQAAVVCEMLDALQTQLESFAASVTAAQKKASADGAALAERMTALEAQFKDAEVPLSDSMSGPLFSESDFPPLLPARATGPVPRESLTNLQLPPSPWATGPAPVHSSHLLRPPSALATGPELMNGSHLTDCPPLMVRATEPVPGDDVSLQLPSPCASGPGSTPASQLPLPPRRTTGSVPLSGWRLPAERLPRPPDAAGPAPLGGLQLPQLPQLSVPDGPYVARPGPVVPIKDILGTIDMFFGNANKHALILDDDYLVPFQRWFQSAVWKLKTGGVSEQQLVPLLCQRLSGPILTALMDRQAIEGFDLATLSLDAFRAKLSGMFADAEAKFTQLALDMRFRPAQLATDLQTLRTYLTHSSLTSSLDTDFVFSLVRGKLNAAYPNCLLIAQSEFQLTLKPSDGFQVFMDTAVTLAQRLQQRKRTRPDAEKEDEPSPGGYETRRRTRTPTKTPPTSAPGAGPSRPPRVTYDAPETATGPSASKLKALLSAPWRRMRPEELKMLGRFASAQQLLEVFERCPRCAHWQGNHAEHRKFCLPGSQRMRLVALRKDLLSGEAPNKQRTDRD
jgi:hypothetical protein